MASEDTGTHDLNKQENLSSPHDGKAPEGTGRKATAEASQTLPLITEELAATYADTGRSEPETTPHVTTPVMPPNPIRRDDVPSSATRLIGEQTKAPVAQAPTAQAATSAGAATSTDTAVHEVEKKDDEDKGGAKVSATQLIAGAAAAATSSVIGGQLGVAGTVVGAGIASIITGLAVTLYQRSLDKGKEKIKEVGSKLAPAVKAQATRSLRPGTAATTRRLGTFGEQGETADAVADANGRVGAESASTSAMSASAVDPGLESDSDQTSEADGSEVNEEKRTWWQQLRRKRILYPAAIGVATFGIGLGAVVMAESFTDADISPGTSQISRSVSGNSGTGDESGTSQDGGSNGGADSSGSQPGEGANQGTGNQGSSTNDGGSTSVNETNTDSSTSADQTGTSQGSETTGADSTSSGTGTDSSGSTSSSADAEGGTSSSDASGGTTDGSQGGSQGGSSGSSASGGSGSSGGGSGSGSGAGSGAGSGGGSSSGGGSAAQG